MNSTNTSPDEPRPGGNCGCGCGCEQCFCQPNHTNDNAANRGWQQGGTSSRPIDIIPTEHMNNMHLSHDSFNDNDTNITGPNDAPDPLTQSNINTLINSYNEADSYQEQWLRQYRMQLDEDPFSAYLSAQPAPSTTGEAEMFSFEQDPGVFGPMDLDGSMHVEDSVHGGGTSVTSRSTSCPQRSHSSRAGSASALLTGMGVPTPGFVFRPLPLLLGAVEEGVCERCGKEHE